jgi:hypothetical protein
MHLQQGSLTPTKKAEEALQELGKSSAKCLSVDIADAFGNLTEKVSWILKFMPCCFETRLTKADCTQGGYLLYTWCNSPEAIGVALVGPLLC